MFRLTCSCSGFSDNKSNTVPVELKYQLQVTCTGSVVLKLKIKLIPILSGLRVFQHSLWSLMNNNPPLIYKHCYMTKIASKIANAGNWGRTID